jgi:4-hydroxy-3-methylbut-2-enyl diphosphate reductase
MPMEVIRATALGMCFGVRDALQRVAEVDQPQDATVHGELVHNEAVAQDLARRGFHQTSEADRQGLPVTGTVVITAHGVSERERHRLLQAGKQLIDTTCPLVRRVHQAARELQRQGYLVIVIGRPGHVEVEGIVGDLAECVVVPDEQAAASYHAPRLGIVCQTTTPPDEARRVVRAIEHRNPGTQVRFIDTVCQPTRERQEAVQELLERVEALVVVGGRHSNNTRQLVGLATARGLPAAHVQSAADLDRAWLARFKVIGLTAGTSTLHETVEEVYRALVEFEVPSESATCPPHQPNPTASG